MSLEGIFRLIFCALILSAFWLRYRAAKVRPFQDEEEVDLQEVIAFLLSGLADGAALIFGVEYILAGGQFAFAYELTYPLWLRSLGMAVGLAGLILLRWSWVHLEGESFPEGISLPSGMHLSGPYRWIRHPVYAATLLTYIGAGLVGSNWVLTFIPPLLHLAAMLRQIPREEELLQEAVGPRDVSYMQRTGMIFPSVSGLLEVGAGEDDRSSRTRAGDSKDLEERSSRGD